MSRCVTPRRTIAEMQDDGQSVGQRVRIIRRRRGLTQQIIADRTGLARSAIANYEAGTRAVDSRKTLHALAAALGVTVGDLTGQPETEKLDPAAAGFHAAVPEVETVLWARGDITDTAAPRTLEQLTAAAQHATQLRGDCDYTSLGPMLAPMLTDAYRHIHNTPENPQAWDVFGNIVYGIGSVLRTRGYSALAWTAVQEAQRAADQTGSQATAGGAAYYRSQILLSRPGALPAALREAETAAAEVASQARTVGDIEFAGMLRLQTSLVTAALGGDPEPHLREAHEQASRLSAAVPAESLTRNRSFRPSNIALWQMSAAMEARDAGRVLALAPGLNPAELLNAHRRAQYFVEIGRAHAMRREYRASLNALLRAEHTAPQHVRGMVHVREIVGLMMRKARRDLTGGDLGKLARRVGVTPI